MTKKCPDCKKFMKETIHGWICNCGYEEIIHIEDLHTTNPRRGWY
jgi:hypothetical protein